MAEVKELNGIKVGMSVVWTEEAKLASKKRARDTAPGIVLEICTWLASRTTVRISMPHRKHKHEKTEVAYLDEIEPLTAPITEEHDTLEPATRNADDMRKAYRERRGHN